MPKSHRAGQKLKQRREKQATYSALNKESKSNITKKKTRRAGRKNQIRRIVQKREHIGKEEYDPLLIDLIGEHTFEYTDLNSYNSDNSLEVGVQKQSNVERDPKNREISISIEKTQEEIKVSVGNIGERKEVREKENNKNTHCKWKLNPLELDLVIYTSNIPISDPRRNRYLQIRQQRLYPLPALESRRYPVTDNLKNKKEKLSKRFSSNISNIEGNIEEYVPS